MTGTRSRGLLPAVALFLLSPLVGEYLLGNLSFSDLPLLPFLAPLYGAGALLIRETARRAGRGSATMLVLGVAYALIEEGLVDQMLFNRSYFTGQAAGSDTYVGFLGVDAWLTIVVVAMHAIWSTYVPIVIGESLAPGGRTTPWLGPLGTGVTVLVFVGGSAYLCRSVYRETGFFASAAHLTGTSVVVVAVIVAAFAARPRAAGPQSDRTAPRPWIVSGFAFVASSLFMLTEMLPGWFEVVGALALVALVVGVVRWWSGRVGFDARHRASLVAGGVLTYAWLGLTMEPETGPRSPIDHVGGVLIACFVLALAGWAVRRSATGINR